MSYLAQVPPAQDQCPLQMAGWHLELKKTVMQIAKQAEGKTVAFCTSLPHLPVFVKGNILNTNVSQVSAQLV